MTNQVNTEITPKYKVRLRAGALIFHSEKLLLNKFGNGVYYNIPGGGVEKNENAQMAVVREVKEETGLDVTVKEFVFALENQPALYESGTSDPHGVSLFFRCEIIGETVLDEKPIQPDVNPDDPNLVASPVWVEVEDLPLLSTLVPNIGKELAEYYKTGRFMPAFINEPYNISTQNRS